MKISLAPLIVLPLLATAAVAKDRPVPKPAPPHEANACAYLGEGYIKAPGSDTCIKVSGYVRSEASVSLGR